MNTLTAPATADRNQRCHPPASAKKLKAAGYATAHFGKWHMGGGRDVDDAPLPQAYGFEESQLKKLAVNRKLA